MQCTIYTAVQFTLTIHYLLLIVVHGVQRSLCARHCIALLQRLGLVITGGIGAARSWWPPTMPSRPPVDSDQCQGNSFLSSCNYNCTYFVHIVIASRLSVLILMAFLWHCIHLVTLSYQFQLDPFESFVVFVCCNKILDIEQTMAVTYQLLIKRWKFYRNHHVQNV